MAIICLLPFIMLISGSFSSEQAIRFTGYGLLPKEFTLEAYRIVFKYPEKIARAYGVSIFITVTGTVLGLFITTMAAYVISRKDFKYRNVISFFFYITTLFNGGMVSTYIFYIQYLHLKDNTGAILPGMVNIFYHSSCAALLRRYPLHWWNPRNNGAGAGPFQIVLRF
ncbi:MAG: hypothetical protein ACLVAW_28060 [Eisenbergiella massiliensis]